MQSLIRLFQLILKLFQHVPFYRIARSYYQRPLALFLCLKQSVIRLSLCIALLFRHRTKILSTMKTRSTALQKTAAMKATPFCRDIFKHI